MMKRNSLVLGILLGILLMAAGARAANTEARLMLKQEQARAGDTITAAIQLTMSPGWHTYWRNGGDSGAPTTIEWKLPTGLSAGAIEWPVPERFIFQGETNFVYHDKVLLMVPIKVAATAPEGLMELSAKVSWLECEKLCVQGSGTVSGSLRISSTPEPSKDAALIDEWRSKLPRPSPATPVRASWDGGPKGDLRGLTIEWTADAKTKSADFLPYLDDNFSVSPATGGTEVTAGKVRLHKSVSKLAGEWPATVSGLVIERDGSDGLVSAAEAKLDLKAAGAVKPGSGSESTTGTSAAALDEKSFAAWLGLAFLGGLILNLMPCVLPVIALKIFGFVNQSREAPARVRQLGLVYGLGVLCSFLVMAGAVIGLQSAGRQTSWGMQFGSIYFVVGMTALVTLVALNFFGVFEVSLGSGTMGSASELASREGATGAFFNGVLTTVLATPCTAPFLAPAVGFAFAQPPRTILLIFVTIALGLAAPYVLLSFQPGWVKFLPKPGAWMEKFKIAMGFPMLGTAMFLLSLVDSEFGDEGILWVGVFLVCVAISAWLWGQFVQRGTRRRALAMALSALFLAGGYVFALEMQLDWRHREAPSGGSTVSRKPGQIDWQPWSRDAVETARKEARPVLVDFTARWCPNCRVNKRTSIEIDSVRKKLKEINALALEGDYTHFPPGITEELKSFKRAGVPLVLVYPKDPSKPPLVLPELLTPSIVLEALDEAAK